jgi:thiosulfate/3-mercaptopyruvate sulfurtransferase
MSTKNFFSLIFSLLIAAQLSAQIITANELSGLIGKPNVVVIDARSSTDYLKTHVNGAINLDVETLSHKTPVEGILKDKSTLASILGKHGISNDKTIIVYCKTGVNAGRLYWILKYLGAKDVRILDGQMDGWFKARKPITKAATKPTATTFTPALKSSLLVNKAYVQSKLNNAGTVLLDTRKKAEYDAGHIGKAVHICHEDFLTGTKIKSNAALTSLFEAAGVTKDKEIILYCKTSTTSGLAYFILTSLLKYPNVKVYDGAYNEWSK